jgi:hypothetical protein
VISTHLSRQAMRDLGHILLERARHAEAEERSVARQLTPAGIESMADLVASGDRPTVGWWLRHSTPPVAIRPWRPDPEVVHRYEAAVNA